MRADGPAGARACSVSGSGLSTHEHGDDGAGAQAEGPVAEHAQEGCDLARVAGDGDVRAVVVREDVVQHGLGPDVLGRRGFAGHAVPEGVGLGEVGFEGVGGEGLVDICCVVSAVAGV